LPLNELKPHIRLVIPAIVIILLLLSIYKLFDIGKTLAKDPSSKELTSEKIYHLLNNPDQITGQGLLLFIDMSAFDCYMCGKDIYAFCDSVEKSNPIRKNYKLKMYVKIKDEIPDYKRGRFIRAWMEGNGFTFDVRLDSNQIFEKLGLEESTLIILKGNTSPFIETFPMGERKRRALLKMLSE